MKRLSAQKTAAAVSAAMHNNSQRTTISSSRRKPKIRIIHIFAPQIIKTDAANFKELVQRLTGNSIADESHHNICSTKKIIRSSSRTVPTRQEEPRIFVPNRKQELGVREYCAGLMRNTKGDDKEEVWRGGNSSRVFAEFDDEGLMQEIDDDGFPFMEATYN